MNLILIRYASTLQIRLVTRYFKLYQIDYRRHTCSVIIILINKLNYKQLIFVNYLISFFLRSLGFDNVTLLKWKTYSYVKEKNRHFGTILSKKKYV